VSFSGELAYELAVPARYADSLMPLLLELGEEYNAISYGLEALGVMRIEKGHAAGNEITGQVTAENMGLGRMVNSGKDCIGKTLSQRPEINGTPAIRLVGFKPVDNTQSLRAGAHFSYIQNGHERLGETVSAISPLHDEAIDVIITSPHFVDPEGDRLHG